MCSYIAMHKHPQSRYHADMPTFQSIFILTLPRKMDLLSLMVTKENGHNYESLGKKKKKKKMVTSLNEMSWIYLAFLLRKKMQNFNNMYSR